MDCVVFIMSVYLNLLQMAFFYGWLEFLLSCHSESPRGEGSCDSSADRAVPQLQAGCAVPSGAARGTEQNLVQQPRCAPGETWAFTPLE